MLKKAGRVRIQDVCRRAEGEAGAHMVTRETGRRLRAEVARMLQEVPEGTVVTLDFAGTGVLDYSCADEFLAKLLTRLIAGEYGEKYLRITGLSASQQENIQVALERKKLPGLVVHADSTWECLGTIKPYLRETLQLIMDRRQVSAREMAGLLRLELNTSSTRLINLHRQRLVLRRERAMEEGGREFIYEGLLGPVGGGGAHG